MICGKETTTTAPGIMIFTYMITVLAISGIFPEVTNTGVCIEGFMDYDLLEQKASQIESLDGDGALSSNTLTSNTYYVIPGLKFICSGTISGLLLGIDVRIDSNRDMFPTLSLYRSANNDNNYNRVSNSTRTIRLGASNFSVSGVYEYNLSDNLQFSAGDVLGIYQPPLDQSVVRLYYRQLEGSDQIHLFTVSNQDQVTIGNNMREQNREVLLHPITSDQSCIAAFISADEIMMEAKKITTVDDEYTSMERLYKDIKFTCDGYITHVIIGTKNLSSIFNPPEIRLWRRNDTGYERSGQTIPLAYDATVQDVSTAFLRWYNLSSPVPVQKDDILGIYNYLPIDDADCLIYYHKYSGPINYYSDLSETGDNHYPLVSVIYGTGETVSVPVTSSLTMQTTMRSLGSSDGTFSQTTSPSLTIIEGKNSGSTTIGVVVGSVISVLLVLVTVAGLIIAVFTFLWRRKYKKFKDASLPNRNYFSSAGLTNMVYSGLPINGGEPGFKADVGLNNPVYEADGTRESKPAEYESPLSTMKSCTGHYEIANSVKTTEALTLPYPEYESCNADLSPPLPEEHSGFATLESKYFTEEPIYWEPESNTESIYQQLSGKGFREIPRETISVSEEIGSGQFGTVHKGIWNTTKGPKEAAIKTLKISATENEEVKFLQEAAINGQFHHRNVVKLFGVVTVGHPIMIVLEFATNGDLREFLVNMRPVPGELPDDSFLTVLSDFSYHVASGMKYLSKKKFVHRDLAARNVLVGDGKICKIADFGMSIDLQDETYYTSHGSMIPLKWTAPEAINFRRYSTQSDVWSFGSVLYEIWSVGHRPFEQHTNQEYISLIESGHRLCPPPGCPEVIYKMMTQSWHPDASSRPTFDELQSMLEDSESFTSETNLKAYTGSVDTYSDVQKIY